MLVKGSENLKLKKNALKNNKSKTLSLTLWYACK